MKNRYKENINNTEIHERILKEAFGEISKHFSSLPFTYRGIKITSKLVKVTMEILNEEENKILPQNCRNLSMEKTPDGLDKRIKIALKSNLRTANIISDVLARAGIVEIEEVENIKTGRKIKATKLLHEWTW